MISLLMKNSLKWLATRKFLTFYRDIMICTSKIRMSEVKTLLIDPLYVDDLQRNLIQLLIYSIKDSN